VNIRTTRIKTLISLLLLSGFSFPVGRLFEIFSWNSSVVKIESIARVSNSSGSPSCEYTQLNENYWRKKSIEDGKIRTNFSFQYIYLNNKAEEYIAFGQKHFLSIKADLIPRFAFRLVYPDEIHC